MARIQLTGKVRSGGSTFTIANEIMPTLKQFPSVRWVKIYDQYGHTERPYGHSDSIPCQPGTVVTEIAVQPTGGPLGGRRPTVCR